MAGESLQSCLAGESGLEGDRRWALMDGTPNRAGKLLTIRQHEGLMTYRARLARDGVEVLTPGGDAHDVDERMVAELAVESQRPLLLRDLAGANFDDSPVLIVNLAGVRAFSAEAGLHVFEPSEGGTSRVAARVRVDAVPLGQLSAAEERGAILAN